MYLFLFFFNDTATTEIYTLSLHDALPISLPPADLRDPSGPDRCADRLGRRGLGARRANGSTIGGGARGARGDDGVGTPDGGSNGHDPPLPARAGGGPGAPGGALPLRGAGAPRGD